MNRRQAMGVVVVTYDSSGVILNCLESLVRADFMELHIVVCDNASRDTTVQLVSEWGRTGRSHPPPSGSPISWEDKPRPELSFSDEQLNSAPIGEEGVRVHLIKSPVNLGFAGGVNLGLRYLQQKGIDLFWLLNPDCIVAPNAPRALAETARANPQFGMIGSRVTFADEPRRIQTDGGGTVNKLTGMTKNINQGAAPEETPSPDPATFDFIVGTSVVVTRHFLNDVGPMNEDYFLFYEEVDWAARRSTFQLGYANGAVIYHHGGTATGSWIAGRRATEDAQYFMYRNRMRFVARFKRFALPFAYLQGLARICGILVVRRSPSEAFAAFRGLHGMQPSAAMRKRYDPSAHALAFGSR